MKHLASAALAGAILLVSGDAIGANAQDARELSIGEMNRLVDSVNWVVGAGCTGMLAPQRVIITNHHCIEEYIGEKTEKIVGPDGEIKEKKVEKVNEVPVYQTHRDHYDVLGVVEYQAKIMAYDKTSDVAVLQIKDKSFFTKAVITFRNEETEPLQRLETVYIVGNPAGEEASITKGVVSGLYREIDWGDRKSSYWQTDAGITGGNSGGGAFDAFGRYIGIPAAVLRAASTTGYVVPFEFIKPVLKKACFASLYGGSDKGCIQSGQTFSKYPPQSSGPGHH